MTEYSCRKHNYQTTGEDGKFRKTVGNNTEVWQSYICTHCGDVIERKIAMWEGWVSKEKGGVK